MANMLRYEMADDYTTEELTRNYERSTPENRMRLPESLYNEIYRPPYKLARLAVQDQNVEVREWIARHGKGLDYRESRLIDGELVYEKPERDLEQHLKNDPDPFVRACLRENPHVFALIPLTATNEFLESNHIERLALMRNPKIHWDHQLLKKIFDYDNQELGITLQERKELICAFLTNKEAFDYLDKTRNLPRSEWPTFDYGMNNNFLISLWELAAKWPKEKPILMPYIVYRYVPGNEETRAKIYKTEQEPVCREAILDSCTERDLETLQLGTVDENESCRSAAQFTIDQLKLNDQIVTDTESDSETPSAGSFLDKIKRWRDDNEELFVAGAFLVFIGLTALFVLFTDEGSRMLAKLADFSSTPLGLIVFWFVLIFLGLLAVGIVVALYNRYQWLHRWFLRIFWLGLMGVGEYVLESKLIAYIAFAGFLASEFLPETWELISNDLADKIVKRLETTNAKK